MNNHRGTGGSDVPFNLSGAAAAFRRLDRDAELHVEDMVRRRKFVHGSCVDSRDIGNRTVRPLCPGDEPVLMQPPPLDIERERRLWTLNDEEEREPARRRRDLAELQREARELRELVRWRPSVAPPQRAPGCHVFYYQQQPADDMMADPIWAGAQAIVDGCPGNESLFVHLIPWDAPATVVKCKARVSTDLVAKMRTIKLFAEHYPVEA
jgi:hypothetical protein